jgi:competence protein ComGF
MLPEIPILARVHLYLPIRGSDSQISERTQIRRLKNRNRKGEEKQLKGIATTDIKGERV